jgi:hypothetical protein
MLRAKFLLAQTKFEITISSQNLKIKFPEPPTGGDSRV